MTPRPRTSQTSSQAIRYTIKLAWRADRRAGALTIGLALVTAVTPAGVAWCAKLVLDELARPSVDSGRAVRLALLGAGIAVLGAGAERLGAYAATALRGAIGIESTGELYTHVNSLSGLSAFESPVFRDRLQLAQQAVQQVPYTVAMFGLEAVQGIVRVGSFVVVLAAVSPPLAILVFAAAVPELVAQVGISRRRTGAAELATPVTRLRGLFQNMLMDVRAAREVRLFGLGRLFHERMLTAARRANRLELDVERRAAWTLTALAILSALVAGVGVLVAIAGVSGGWLTIGDVSLLIAGTAGVQGGLSTLISQLGQVTEGLRLFRHYQYVVAAPNDLTNGTIAAPALRRDIVLRDVWFRYEPDGPWVLRGVSMTIHAGRSLGLVGVNGAGKSTLVKLLCRFYDPQRGQILWDGRDIRDFDLATLRQRVGAAFQDYMTFDLTASENIGVGRVEALDDLDGIRAAARAAEIDERLTALPRGYATLLSRTYMLESESGVQLSGGEWQRVALARALLRGDADLLVLDEPNSGLDPDAEHRVHQTLRRHRTGRTSLLISHRLGALRDADLIVVLAQGQVVEQGTHDALMAGGGHYARLFHRQAARYQDARVAAGDAP